MKPDTVARISGVVKAADEDQPRYCLVCGIESFNGWCVETEIGNYKLTIGVCLVCAEIMQLVSRVRDC